MIRIGFVGVPGSGKTSTARSIAASCRTNDKLNNVELVSEYARRYISKHGPIDNLWEQIRIMNKQIEWEDSIIGADILITDSPIHLGFLYCLELYNSKDSKQVMLMNDAYKMLNRHNYPIRYNIIFHLNPMTAAINDGIRTKEQLNKTWRQDKNEVFKVIFREMFKPKLYHIIISTTLEDRTKESLTKIKEYISGYYSIG